MRHQKTYSENKKTTDYVQLNYDNNEFIRYEDFVVNQKTLRRDTRKKSIN